MHVLTYFPNCQKLSQILTTSKKFKTLKKIRRFSSKFHVSNLGNPFTNKTSKIINKMNSTNKAKLVRKASPSRQESEDTFRKKLEEIKKMRQQHSNEPSKPKVIVNGKPALEVQGDWALFFSASKGKKYYFNLKTQVNQWTKPKTWIGGEEVMSNLTLIIITNVAFWNLHL